MLNDNDIFHRLNLDNIKIISSSKAEVKNFLSNQISNISREKLLITFNLDFYRNTENYTQFKQICEAADYVFPDGIGITYLLKLKYKINIKRITGNDLFIILLELANEFHLNVALIGSTPNTLGKLTDKIISNYPELNICSAISPPLGFEKRPTYDKEIIGELKKSKPGILLLALGSPRQEIWLDENKEAIGAKINMGVGAVFDFYTETKKRSPDFMQKLGLEWFWRLLNEPIRLFRRYIVNDLPFFIYKAFNILVDKYLKKK